MTNKRKKKLFRQKILKIAYIFIIFNLVSFLMASVIRAEDETTGFGDNTADTEQVSNLEKNNAVIIPEETADAGETASTTPAEDTEETNDTASSTPENINSLTQNESQNATSTEEILSDSNDTASSTPDVANAEYADTNSPSGNTETSSADDCANNVDTGAGSDNDAAANLDNQTDIQNNNNAVVINKSVIEAETGNNVASYNTGSGVITTQEANGRGELVNVINKNSTNVDTTLPAESNAGNTDTGADSNNTAYENINNQLTVKNVNSSNTLNEVDAYVSSGNNKTNYNSGHGINITGDANLGFDFITMANTNLVGNQKFYANWQNIYDNWTGDINIGGEAGANASPLSNILVEASNNCTGVGSNNQAIVNVNDQVSITNQNNGNIKNQINAEVISGRNEANGNTGSGSVTSGNVNSAINMVNFLNSNITSSNWYLKTLNVFNDWNGNLVLPKVSQPNLTVSEYVPVAVNNGTGAGSDNSTEVNVNNEVSIENSNDAIINNNVSIKTNTGSNKSSYNGGSGVQKYGEAKAETNELNVANTNVTGDSWWMVVVNKFGEWQGSSVGSPTDTQVSTSEKSVIFTPLNAGIEVANNATGPESNNDAGANINHTTEITNDNTAYISNDLNLDAVSGENETQYNTGHGYIETGNIRACNNIINFANSNITVGNWLVTVVNVFGKWAGNLVFDTSAATSGSDNSTDSGSQSGAGNTNTGTNSDNNAAGNTNNNTDVTNNNNSNTTNNTSSSASSGNNSASYNTGSGVITTGGANSTNNVANQVNTNNVNVNSGGSGGSSAGNANTGANSDNTAIANNNNNTNVTNNNNSNTTNNYSVSNNTGSNSSNYNTGSGIIDTGWANAFLEVYNQNNENKITLGELIDEVNGDDNGGDDNGDDNGGNTDNGGNNNGGSGSDTGSSVTAQSVGGGGAVVLAKDKRKLRGDLNGDGKIDDYDFSILMANWGKKIAEKFFDPSGDAKIDDFDLSIVMASWGKILMATL